jgi:hypothetical protein
MGFACGGSDVPGTASDGCGRIQHIDALAHWHTDLVHRFAPEADERAACSAG